MTRACSLIAVAVAVASLSPACVPSSGAPDDGPGALTPEAILDRLTVRAVEATQTHLLDWGNGQQMDPALVASGQLEVRYCEKHFPTGSQALANLKKAVDAYNQIPGLSFDLPVLPQPGTATAHPDLATFALPANAIYVDYDDLKPGAWAATSIVSASCGAPTTSRGPRPCSKAHLYAAADKYDSDDAPLDPTALPPSVGVFMHELGHAFGQAHIVPDSDSGPPVLVDAESIVYDRVTIHGPKHHGEDPRETSIQAATLAFLRTSYADSSAGLDTDELTVHPVMGLADLVALSNVEITPAKDFSHGTASIADGLNETKLRWSASRGAFVACATGQKPVWLGRYSDLSTNAVSKDYTIAYTVSSLEAPITTPSQWTRVSTKVGLHTHDPGESDFRQIDWRNTLTITAAQANVPASGPTAMIKRKLGFVVDADNTVAERREGNNDWAVTLCLYPESDTACAAACDQQ